MHGHLHIGANENKMGNCQSPSRRDDFEPYDQLSDDNLMHYNWMSKLQDNLSLAQLSIPGTHDSLAFRGGCLVQTQSWPLMKQYQAGIRYSIRFQDNVRP